MCVQMEDTIVGQEDCLLLNVYVPVRVYNEPTTNVPVMAYIHGGGLVSIKLVQDTIKTQMAEQDLSSSAKVRDETFAG